MPTLPDFSTLLGLSVALGIGLLVGAERERRKGSGPTRGTYRAGAGAGHRGGLAGRVAGVKDATLRSHAAEYIAANTR